MLVIIKLSCLTKLELNHTSRESTEKNPKYLKLNNILLNKPFIQEEIKRETVKARMLIPKVRNEIKVSALATSITFYGKF